MTIKKRMMTMMKKRMISRLKKRVISSMKKRVISRMKKVMASKTLITLLTKKKWMRRRKELLNCMILWTTLNPVIS